MWSTNKLEMDHESHNPIPSTLPLLFHKFHKFILFLPSAVVPKLVMVPFFCGGLLLYEVPCAAIMVHARSYQKHMRSHIISTFATCKFATAPLGSTVQFWNHCPCALIQMMDNGACTNVFLWSSHMSWDHKEKMVLSEILYLVIRIAVS